MPNGEQDHRKTYASEMQDRLSVLRKSIRQYNNKLNASVRMKNEDAKAALQEIKGSVDFLGDLIEKSFRLIESRGPRLQEMGGQPTSPVSIEPDDKDDFADFLGKIGESVVRSQKALDDRSIEYLKSIQSRPYIPPTLFRIPKISAELKVALDQTKTTGLNVILFSHKEKMNQLNEQTLNVEIAAVPPTPDLLQRLQDLVPRIDFVFDRVQRESVFDLIKESIPKPPSSRSDASAKQLRKLRRIFLPENRDRVVIWSRNEGKQYLILFSGKDGNDDVGVWSFDTGNKKLTAVVRPELKAKQGENQEPLHRFVDDLGNAQAKLLSGL